MTTLTATQLQALKAAINGETDPTFVSYRVNGQTPLMAEWLNQPHASMKAWDRAAPWGPVFNAIDGAKYTPALAQVNTSVDTAATNKLLVNLLKLQVQQNMLLAMATIDARDSGTVDALLDSVSAVYTLNGTSTTSPGGLAGVNVAGKLTRAALRGEAIFDGEDVIKATVVAKILVFEGFISDADIGAALEV